MENLLQELENLMYSEDVVQSEYVGELDFN